MSLVDLYMYGMMPIGLLATLVLAAVVKIKYPYNSYNDPFPAYIPVLVAGTFLSLVAGFVIPFVIVCFILYCTVNGIEQVLRPKLEEKEKE